MSEGPVKFEKNTVISVFGASGDLAKKKTFPALFGLFREGYLDPSTKIFGYARSKLSMEDLKSRVLPHLKKPHGEADDSKVEQFFKMVSYISGNYDTDEGFDELRTQIEKFEKSANVDVPHRLFYLALPPSVFLTVAKQIKSRVYAENGITRVIVEKPFGHDLASARELQKNLGPLFKEEELYRIDHYLGKELVKNLLVLRFGNQFLNASWNRDNIQSVQISFKERFGTEGRGGYFDSIGIIRDVMQNHLLQIMTLLTMERPVSFDPESIRDEKVKVLKAVAPIDTDDVLLGQYGKSEDGSKPAYVDDDTVDKDSKCVTFAAMTFNIENGRWEGVPIMMRAGKALNESKVEIRLQYKAVASGVFKDIPNNELVIRVQPDAAVYLKFNAKTPGLSNATQVTDLNLTYASRYQDFWIPEAYEVLIRDALLGDHSNFVRDDELDISWGIFTPLLKHIERPDGPTPEIYPYGSRGPKGLKEYMQKHKYVMPEKHPYAWPVTKPEDTKDN
ncbi:AVN_collapsed_G0044520.mRNA.1.CDS.1 [Saccharomyces cerevisiae]|nr:ANM_HP_G0096990.mRNA.1.CDS.1 [Saccharomyces cerevisiae]CAI4926405.1 ANM_HP_G0109980.mRNA.1.CDS.1 [Saccharomyces cerevisiae]CAI4980388.1 ANM_HP_G0148080.mRNA.1.CDS.1 [Saccharomyces cerevisiae]CAI5007595.1 ANM_HP_G0168950.mRNA.1.CDS.1 [Saccharomyces cerevisiae]CAI5218481.1 ANM_HP_G0028330.mRNA.1.CDS.1 [Saccharomyces cerevisiae]